MKKDIAFPPVENVYIAITRHIDELNNTNWDVYIINKNDVPISNVFVRAKGYGHTDGERQQTSTLRHHFVTIEPQTYAFIEPIDPGIFHLYNEYWISYFIGDQIYDKKFIFVPESIVENNLIFIPQLNKQGVLHV